MVKKKTPWAADIIHFAASITRGPSMCVLDSLETKNFISFPTRVGPPWSLRGGSFTFHRSKGSRVGAGPGGAWGSGVGPSRCQAAGKGHPTQAGSGERSVGDREGRAHIPPSFLPTPFSRAWLFRGSSAFPSHQRPPSPFFPAPAHLRPLQRARPRPRPPLVGPRAPVPSPSWPRPLSQ